MPTSLRTLNLQDALELQDHILAVALTDGLKPVAICVVNAAGTQLCAATMNGVKAPSVQFAHDKAVTAINFGRDTINFRFVQNEEDMWIPAGYNGWDDNDVANARNAPAFISWAGGVLVVSRQDGYILGAIGVSNRSEIEDHELASQRPSGWSA